VAKTELKLNAQRASQQAATSSSPLPHCSSKLSHIVEVVTIAMAPTRNASNPTPRAQATPYQTRSKAIGGTIPSKTSTNAKIDLVDDNSEDENGESQDSYAIASGSREKCSPKQTADLEALFWSSRGFPTRLEKEEIAARINK
jgi:hypothetical protein